MSYVSHAHATLAAGNLARSALPDAPVVEEPVRTPRFRPPSRIRLTLAWRRPAGETVRTWELGRAA